MRSIILKNNLEIVLDDKNNNSTCVIGFISKNGYSTIDYNIFPDCVTYFVSKLFVKANASLSEKQVLENIDILGKNFEIRVEKENVLFYLHVNKEDMLPASNLLAKLIQEITINKEVIDSVRKEIQAEIISKGRSTSLQFGLANVFNDNNYGKAKLTSIDQLALSTEETVYKYLLTYFNPKNCVLFVSGNYNELDYIDRCKYLWENWAPSYSFDSQTQIKKIDIDIYNQLPSIHFNNAIKESADINLLFFIKEGFVPKEIEYTRSTIGDSNLLPNIKNILISNTLNSDESQILQDNFIERVAIYMIVNEMLVGSESSNFVYSNRADNYYNFVLSQYLQHSSFSIISVYLNCENRNILNCVDKFVARLKELKNNIEFDQSFTKSRASLKLELIEMQNNLVNVSLNNILNYILQGVDYNVSDLLTKINFIDRNQVQKFFNEIISSENLHISINCSERENRKIENLFQNLL